jgi:apolipoprotein N-acyltransferase
MFSILGLGMLVAILQKRKKMSNKDVLLEQAAMSAAGLQQAHVLGIVILVVLVIAVFALLGLKNITWALLLIMNTALFGYLLKLTIDSGVKTGETIIGPDGAIIRKDSEDSSMASSQGRNPNTGTYTLPTLA